MRLVNRICICILLVVLVISNVHIVRAVDDDVVERYYVIYDEAGGYLFEKTGVCVGDYYITNDYRKYEIIALDDNNNIGKARFVRLIDRPNISISDNANPISTADKTICLYMTHNDESYVPTDGVDSVYGKGGIHDVAKRLARGLQSYGITTHIDETLHIPHDYLAYSRSKNTAKRMIDEYEPNAIFDIHRDGTSRSQYAKVLDGVETSMVRIVVGKANSNMEINENFAIYLMTVGNEIAPGLFKDIYYASGHYNQALHPKAILFEMGCHMIEKELVLSSCDRLAEVVNVALFNTTVDNNTGDLTINDTPTADAPTIDEALEQQNDEVNSNRANTSSLIRLLVWLAIVVGLVGYIIKYLKKKR